MLALSSSGSPCHWPQTSSDQWCYYNREKKKTDLRKSRKENRRKVYSDIFLGRKLQGRKEHFQTAMFTTISDRRWDKNGYLLKKKYRT
jgi:hypothetical protein